MKPIINTSFADILNGNRPELLRDQSKPIVFETDHECDFIGCGNKASHYRHSIFKHGASIYTCLNHTPDSAKGVNQAGYFTVHAL